MKLDRPGQTRHGVGWMARQLPHSRQARPSPFHLLLLLLKLALSGCASSAERDPQANCDPRFEPMARGLVSCESLGDQCAYSRDALTGAGKLVPLGSADTYWTCTCGGDTSTIKQYWCK